MQIEDETQRLVLPGDLITENTDFMSGNGTYQTNGKIYSSMMGFVQKFGQVLLVLPIKTRYQGELGDVVIGRVVEIVNKKWAIDIQGINLGYLHINSVKLDDIQVDQKEKKD